MVNSINKLTLAEIKRSAAYKRLPAGLGKSSAKKAQLIILMKKYKNKKVVKKRKKIVGGGIFDILKRKKKKKNKKKDLLDIVKERGVLDIIQGYKDDLENKYELVLRTADYIRGKNFIIDVESKKYRSKSKKAKFIKDELNKIRNWSSRKNHFYFIDGKTNRQTITKQQADNLKAKGFKIKNAKTNKILSNSMRTIIKKADKEINDIRDERPYGLEEEEAFQEKWDTDDIDVVLTDYRNNYPVLYLEIYYDNKLHSEKLIDTGADKEVMDIMKDE